MTWRKMIFRSDPVWVLVDERGEPILDREGRAEMKYRQSDVKSYRPGASNLTSTSTSPSSDDSGAASDLSVVPPAAARPAGKQALEFAGRAPVVRSGGPSRHPAALEVWTDGACSGNPGPMGIGVVIVDGAFRDELSDYLGVGTNNIAELVAIERGVEASLKRIATTARLVQVYTDSSYAIGLLSKSWKAKANQELVQRIRGKLAAFPAAIEFVKVAGHAGIPENERCDELARLAVERRG